MICANAKYWMKCRIASSSSSTIKVSINSISSQIQASTMSTTAHTGFNFEDTFSPENKARTIETLTKQQSWSKVENFVGKIKKKAAVLIPLCYDEETNSPAILYNLRSKTMNKHKGEISFPGGACDAEDNDDLVVTALRETEEELGIDRGRIEIWTTLPYVPTVTSLIRVAPVLALIKDPVNPKSLKVNRDEVEFAFTVPLAHLCDPINWGMTHFTRHCQKLSMPEFRNLEKYMSINDNHTETVVLWGLTSIVTHVVLAALLPQIYQRDIPITRDTSTNSIPKQKL